MSDESELAVGADLIGERRHLLPEPVPASAFTETGADPGGVVAVLDQDVMLRSDGGGRVTAARNPVHGADRITDVRVVMNPEKISLWN